jgi:hypothetical protein
MLSVGRRDEARFETSKVSARAFAAGREALTQGDTDLARAAFRWARRADPGNPLYIHGEAVVAHRTGNFHDAEYLYRRVLDMAMRAFGTGDPRVAIAAQGLVDLCREQGRHEEAETLVRFLVDSLDRRTAARAGMATLSALARICDATGRRNAALAVHGQALVWRRGIFGEHHDKTRDCAAAIDGLKRGWAIRRTDPATSAAAAPGPDVAPHAEPESARSPAHLM